MKAIIVKDFGGVEILTETEIENPEIKSNGVLIQVKSISINLVDVKTRQGKGLASKLKEENPVVIIGWDISGVIKNIGNSVKNFKVGDEVFGMINFPGSGKAYAEYVAAPESHLALKPANISHEEAAAATLAALTAWQVLVTQGKIKNGDKVLIHSASGGVGHFAVQIAKYFGAFVIGTSSGANKDFVLSIGADQHIDYQTEKFDEIIKDADFILDAQGGDNAIRSVSATKKGGKVISILSGVPEVINEIAKEKGVDWSFYLVESNGEDMKKIAGLLEKGIIKPFVSHIFPFKEMTKAHLQVETGKTRGKVIVNV